MRRTRSIVRGSGGTGNLYVSSVPLILIRRVYTPDIACWNARLWDNHDFWSGIDHGMVWRLDGDLH